MYKPKIFCFSFNLVLILIVFSFFTILQTAYGDKELNFGKTEDVKSQVLFGTLSDLQSYPQIFPEYIKSVELTGDKTAKFNVGSNGIFFDVQTQYTQLPDGSYVVEVISGDLKGSRIVTTLQKTWGFDGSADGGTVVNMEILLQTSGVLSLLVPSIPDQAILSNLDTGLDKFAAYAKNEDKTSSALKDKSLIKNEALLWSKGGIDDTTFALEIQRMVKNDIMLKPQTQLSEKTASLPSWLKTNAIWWADGRISDADFDSTIQYLIDSRIMKI